MPVMPSICYALVRTYIAKDLSTTLVCIRSSIFHDAENRLFITLCDCDSVLCACALIVWLLHALLLIRQTCLFASLLCLPVVRRPSSSSAQFFIRGNTDQRDDTLTRGQRSWSYLTFCRSSSRVVVASDFPGRKSR